MDERLPVVLHLLGDAILLQDVDDADEEKQVFAAVVLGRNAAPDVVKPGGQSEVGIFEDLTVGTDAAAEGKVGS